MRFFLIHGANGSAQGGWFPWLADRLRAQGHEVIVPQFPTIRDQTLHDWMQVFSPYLDRIDRNSVFVGHSLGCSFILHALEKSRFQVRACFLVAGFVGALDDPHFDPLVSTFTQREFDWERIKRQSKEFYIFHSKDDTVVPFEKARQLAGKLHVPILVYDGAGHFDCRKFEGLFRKIQQMTDRS